MPYTKKFLASLTQEELDNLPPDISYDLLWKDFVEYYFREFVAFTLPKLHDDIDWSIPIKFLEQEIPEMLGASKSVKKKQTDKLAEVTLKDGTKRLLLYHIEFENSGKPILTFRMFDYRFLIYLRFKTHLITAIVVYTGEKRPKIYDHYELEDYGTSLRYQFNTYTVAEQKEEDLLANSNPFAIIVLANLYVLKSKKDMNLRLEYKKKLMLEIEKRSYDLEKSKRLSRFVLLLVGLPLKQEQKFEEDIIQLIPHKSMYVNITQQDRNLVDVMAQRYYGTTVKQEKQERIAAQKLLMQERKEKEQVIINLFYAQKMSLEKIAGVMSMTVGKIERIIKNNEVS